MSSVEIQALAVLGALKDAGYRLSELDGVISLTHEAHGLTGGRGSTLFRAIRESNKSSNKLSGTTLLRLSLATTISGREWPKTSCSSASRITLLCFLILAP